MLNLFFSNCTFRNSPTSPGINCNANPETYTTKLPLSGMVMLAFFNSICQYEFIPLYLNKERRFSFFPARGRIPEKNQNTILGKEMERGTTLIFDKPGNGLHYLVTPT